MNKFKNKILKYYNYFVIFATSFSCFCLNVFAEEEDPLSVVNNLSNFIFTLMRGIGLIVTGYGILQVGLSFKSHDPSQRAEAMMVIGGGIIITFAKTILDLIMGG